MPIGLIFLSVVSMLVFSYLIPRPSPEMSNDIRDNQNEQEIIDQAQPNSEDAVKSNVREIDKPVIEAQIIDTSSFPKHIDVEFASGQKISVKYEIDGSDKLPPLTSENISEYVDLLLELAERDDNAEAAHELSEALDLCSEVPKSEEDYYSQYDDLVVNGNYRIGSSQNSQRVEPGSNDHHNLIDAFKFNYHLCRDVSPDLISQKELWQEKAIELNSYSALTQKAGELFFNDPAEAYKLYLQAWNAGHIDVAMAVGVAYHHGIPELDDVNRDPITAFAYTLVQNKVIKAYLDQSESPSAINLSSLYASELSGSERLSPSEYLEAEKLAIKLIQDNENCCKGHWTIYDN